MRRVLQIITLALFGAAWGCSGPVSRGERTDSVQQETSLVTGYDLQNAPPSADPGTSVSVDWSALTTHSTNDWLGLYKVGDPDTSPSASLYPLGAAGVGAGNVSLTLPNGASGSYEFRYFLDNGYTKAAVSNAISINPVAYTVAGDTYAFPGTAVNGNWTAPATHSTYDWIGLYKVGDPDSAVLISVYPLGAAGLTAGSFQLGMPGNAAAGAYEFRYFLNYSYTLAATSGVIGVYSVSAPATADPGTSVMANWAGPTTHSTNDWMGLYKVGDPDSSPYASVYPLGQAGVGSGSASMYLPSDATGNWEVRYFLNNSYTRGATSNTISANIIAGSYTVSGPASAPAGSQISANWTAPTTHSTLDWIGLYQVGAPDSSPASSAYPLGAAGQGAGSAFVMLPVGATGTWELRYFLNNGVVKAATSGPILAQ